MSKEKNEEVVQKKNHLFAWILAIVLVIIVAVAAGVLIAYKNGVFSADNFEHLNYNKYLVLPEYKGLQYERPVVEVTDEEVQSRIDSHVQSNTTEVDETEGVVADGDKVIISYVGMMDGKKFDGGTASNIELTIGSQSYIDGFESGLIGKKIGETVTLDLTFPDPYVNNPDLAGKPVTFEVTINSKRVTHTPEYNLDYVKQYTSYDSLEAFEDSIRQEIVKSKEQSAMNEVKNTLWSEIIEKTEVIGYPEKQLENLKTTTREQYVSYATSSGKTLEEVLKENDMTEEDLDNNIQTYAENIVKQKMLLNALAKKEGIKLTNKGYKEELLKMLQNAGFTEETFASAYGMTIEEYGEQNDFRASMLLDKVLDKVVEYAEEVEPGTLQKDDAAEEAEHDHEHEGEAAEAADAEAGSSAEETGSAAEEGSSAK